MSSIFSFNYRKDNGDSGHYFVWEKEIDSYYLKGIDLKENQFKTFRLSGITKSVPVANVTDSDMVDFQVLTLTELCNMVSFNTNHVGLVGMSTFLNVANKLLKNDKKVLHLDDNAFLLYGSQNREIILYTQKGNHRLVLNVGPNGTPLKFTLNGNPVSNDELVRLCST